MPAAARAPPGEVARGACAIVAGGGHRPGRGPGGAGPRGARPPEVGRPARGQADGPRRGSPPPRRHGRPGARAGPGHRREGGRQQGARDRVEPRREVARRRGGPGASGVGPPGGRRGGPRRQAGLDARRRRDAGGPRRARPGRGVAHLVSRLLPAEPWRRNQHVTAAMVFVVFTAFAFVLPFLPLYVRELGVRGDDAVALWAGVLIGVAPLLAGLLAPLWGRLADRHGPKRMAVLALGGYVVLLALSAAVTSVGQLLALRIGVGLFGGIGPLGLAMATSLAPREQTGRAVGTIQAAQILSAAVGPLLGGLLADLVGIRRTFLATAA